MGLYNKTIILEFNGIPGCGKTTTANLLVKKLKMMGYKASKIEDLQVSNRLIKNLKLSINAMRISNLSVIYNLLRLWICLKPFKFSRLEYVKIIYNFYFIYHLYRKQGEYDFIICDQGIIQAILSIIHTDRFDNNIYIRQLSNELLRNFAYIYWINCDIDSIVAKERIRSRNLKQGRLDLIKNDDELLTSLLKQEENLHTIRKIVEEISGKYTINIGMNYSPNENIEKIINIIKTNI